MTRSEVHVFAQSRDMQSLVNSKPWDLYWTVQKMLTLSRRNHVQDDDRA